MPTDTPCSRLVGQRMRNLIIEYVRTVANYKVGEMPGIHELICMWEDYVLRPLPLFQQQFQSPVYTLEEKAALEEVDQAWEVFGSTITDEMLYENEPQVLATPEWRTFASVAASAQKSMSKRGKLAEDYN